MKKSIVLFFFITITSIIISQEVPNAVQKSFSDKFSEGLVQAWQQLDDGDWLVFFQLHNEGYQAVFSDQGEWVQTAYFIDLDSIPILIWEGLTRKYPEPDISSLEAIESPYEVIYTFTLLTPEFEYLIVTMTENGEIIDKEHDQESEEE